MIGKKKGTGEERDHAWTAWELPKGKNHSPKALIRARKYWTRTWTHRAMVRPHANQNLVMLHTLKRSVPIPCGSNTQDFDANPFSVRGSCLKPSHQPQMNKRTNSIKTVKRHASRCEAALWNHGLNESPCSTGRKRSGIDRSRNFSRIEFQFVTSIRLWKTLRLGLPKSSLGPFDFRDRNRSTWASAS